MRYTEAPFFFGPLAWDCILSFGQLLRQRQSRTALHTRSFLLVPSRGAAFPVSGSCCRQREALDMSLQLRRSR